MTRITPPGDDELDADGRALAAQITGPRSGTLGGPFGIWMRVPEIARRIDELSDLLRRNSTIEKRLQEVMILVVERYWNAHYAWTAHARAALAEGLSPDVIEAIRTGQPPAFAHAGEQLVYDFTTEFLQTRAVGDATYARFIEAFGRERTIEFVAAIGLYTMIGMTLAAFDVPPLKGPGTL